MMLRRTVSLLFLVVILVLGFLGDTTAVAATADEGEKGSVAPTLPTDPPYDYPFAPYRLTPDKAARFLDAPGPADCVTSDELDAYLLDRYRLALHLAKLASEGADGPTVPETGEVRNRDGIYLVEADETILLHDNPGDLDGRSLRFVPEAGGGYTVTVDDAVYDQNIGSLVLSNPSSPTFVRIDLANFTFPLGGSSYSTLWAGTDISVRTDDGSSMPGFSSLQYGEDSARLGTDLLLDRAPRLGPLFHAMQGISGRWIWVSDTSERLLITWRRSDDPTSGIYLDVQAVLYPDGTIVFTYEAVRNIDNGAPLVYADIESWLSGFSLIAFDSDHADVDPDYVDIRGFWAHDDPGSEMLRMRTTYDAPLPATSAVPYFYGIDVWQGGVYLYQFLLRLDSDGLSDVWVKPISSGVYTSLSDPVVDGNTWDILIGLSELPELTPGSVEFRPFTYDGTNTLDWFSVTGTVTGGPALARDYTEDQPFTSDLPIVETFLFPLFLPHGVKDKLLAHTGWDETRIDAIPMYQDFFTDWWLFKWAYYTGGNCGAANIGKCDPGAPLEPGLLHMHKTNWYLNDSESANRFHVLSHEFGHHWLQDILIDEGSGPSDILNPFSRHPAAYVDTEALRDIVYPEDSSVMGGGYWIDNGDGTWTSFSDYTWYSFPGHHLYLMGLMAPGEVENWFYLADTDPPQPLEYYPEPDTTVTGEYHPVTIQMVLDAMGTRDPVYPAAKTDFFTPMVLVIRPGQEPSTEDWDFMLSVRHPWRDTFHDQTVDRGTVTTVSPREVSPPPTSPLRIEKQGGGVLRFYFEDPDFADQVTFNLYEGAIGGAYDDWAPSLCGQVPTLQGSEFYLDATPSAGDRYFLVTMSNRVFEGDAGNASDDTPRTTVATRCGGQP